MSIDRQHGEIIFICDECDEVLESKTGDFYYAWEHAKELGWRAERQLDKTWLHNCGECAVEEA